MGGSYHHMNFTSTTNKYDYEHHDRRIDGECMIL
jgi:hypothetical protein